MTRPICRACAGEQVIRIGVEYDATTGRWIYDDAVACPDCSQPTPCPACKGACDVPTTDPARDTDVCWLCRGAGVLEVAA